MNYLIFIPARGGSKTVKNKNLKKIKNRPLISYTLKTAKEIRKKIKSDIFVSTDSKKILNYCKKKLTLSNYLRPKKLSKDNSKVIDAVFHCIKYQKKLQKFYSSIILLQPTSPVRKVDDIITAIKYYEKKKCKSLMSVCSVREHPNEIINIKKNLKWNFLKENKNKNFHKQQLKKDYYFIDGNFYISDLNFLKENKSFISKKLSIPFITNKTWPIDIDYLDDFKVAERFV